MDTAAFLSSVLIPLTENAGEVAQMDQLLSMLEHYFIEAFQMSLPTDSKSETSAAAATLTTQSTASPPLTTSIDAGEEAKLLAVRAVVNFHRRGAASRHRDFFQRRDYHPHAALFILELLKSLSGNSQQWFRQLQLDSLEACLAIVEVIGMDNVRLCLPGVVSVGARYVHRSHHGKDSSKVCLTALRLLRTALVLSFSSPEPVAWGRDTVAHLTGTLRSILEPAALVRGAFSPSVIVALGALVTSLLVSPGMAAHLATPLGSLLVVAFAAVTNMDHLHHLGEESTAFADSRQARISHTPAEARQISAVVSSPFAVAAVQDALQYLRGVELLHVATTAVRLPVLRDCLFPLPVPCASTTRTTAATDGQESRSVAPGAASSESVVALILSVVRKCVRLVGTEMSEDSLYTHRQPRKYPAGVVDEFLLSLSGALARLPVTGSDEDSGDNVASEEETVGERVTNALLDDYGAMLQDWDAYATHPPVLYVLTRLVAWQFHPSHQRMCDRESEAQLSSSGLHESAVVCAYPFPSELLLSGAFEQLWSTVAPPHIWSITEDEDLCNNQQIHHRQVVAATLLRFLTLTADLLSVDARGNASHKETKGTAQRRQEGVDALERLYALTLYLVLEKATARGVVHEAAMQCLEAYSNAAREADTLSFLLGHSSLIVDETARAVREEHLRPAAASVLRGSLALLEARLTRSAHSGRQEEQQAGRFSGSGTQMTAVVRQRLSLSEMAAFFQRGGDVPLAALETVAQVADFVGSTLHVACDTLYLCSRYNSSTTAEDLSGRRAALALLRDAFDLAAFLNFCAPQEALDEDQERHTTSAHTRVRALQAAALDAVFTVLQYCTVHDATAPFAVQTVVRGLTCFLTTNTAITWAEKARQRLHDAEMARRRAAREKSGGGGSRRGGRVRKVMEKLLDQGDNEAKDEGSDDAGNKSEEEMEGEEEGGAGEGRLALPAPPPLDWPWTHYVPAAATTSEAAPPTNSIELPRSHLHTVYRVYLSLFALLREPMAAFATVTAGPASRSGVERRKLAEVAVTPAVFETLNGMESLRLLACDFLLHRMVEEVLPLVLLWHERGCVSRIPTHTEERLKTATQQFIARLVTDCSESAELERTVSARCRGFPLLAAVAARAEGLAASAPEEAEAAESPLLVPQMTQSA